MLRIDLQPAPLVIASLDRTVDIVRLHRTEAEKGFCGCLRRVGVVKHLRIGENQRFPIPVEPKVAVQALAVDLVIEMHQRHLGMRSRTERKKEADLRHIDPVFLSLVPDFHQGIGALVPGQAAIGAVEKDSIDFGIGEHLRMLAQNPLVCCAVIAEERLVPIAVAVIASSPPGLMVIVMDGFGILSQDPGDVLHRCSRSVLHLVPGPIEHYDGLVLCWSIISPDLAAKGICRGIRVASGDLRIKGEWKGECCRGENDCRHLEESVVFH